MDVLDDIRIFLDKGQDFDEGLALLEQVEVNRGILSFLARKRDMQALRYQLSKRLKLPPRKLLLKDRMKRPAAKSTQSVDGSKAPAVNRHRRTRREDLPERLHPVYDGIAGKYKVQRSLHEKMKLLSSSEGNEAEVAEIRGQIVELESQIRDAWKTIDEELDKEDTGDASGNAAAVTASVPFKASLHKAYISKALAKEDLSESRKAEVMKRVRDLLDYNIPISDKMVEKLRGKGLWPK